MAKISGYPNATGYWGPSPRARIAADNTPQKVLAWNLDKIRAMGIPFAMWESVNAIPGTYVKCSCVKDTTSQADIPCLSCYGQQQIPGYMRFGYNYTWAASVSPGWTFSNTGMDMSRTPNRIQLLPGQTTGTAISAQVAVDTTGIISKFEYKSDHYLRETGSGDNSITVEFSSVAANASPNWQPIATLTTLSALPFPFIQFRISMTRSSAAKKSPMFEIIRVRWQTIADLVPTNEGGLVEAVVRVLSTWDDEATVRGPRGDEVESKNQVFWTLPLNLLDKSRTTISLQKIVDDCFVEDRTLGPEQGVRYALTNFNYSNNFGIFTRQQFSMRRIQGDGSSKLAGEVYYKVF